jgi:hypothetical protein
VIVIALLARYGYKSADTEIDGLISAFMFATIVAGGLGGHAVAIRIWRRNGWWALAIGLVAAIALIVDVARRRREERSARWATASAEDPSSLSTWVGSGLVEVCVPCCLALSVVRCHSISTVPRFQSPPRRTQDADFPLLRSPACFALRFMAGPGGL